MKSSARNVFLAVVLLGTGLVMVLVGRHETAQQAPSLRPVLDRATETKAAVDHVGQELTRVSTEDEVALGRSLIAMDVERCRFPEEAPANRVADQRYLEAILNRLVAQGGLRRPDIPYRVRLLEHPAINAFAVPGGFIFVTTGMMDFLQTEAEVAAVLGHEMAHVELRHCIERYQYALKARQTGVPGIEEMAQLGTTLMLQGYQDEQEAEADRWGMQLAARAKYHPQGGQWAFRRMKEHFGEVVVVPKRATGEVAFGLMDGLEDLVATHPNLDLRISNLDRALSDTGLLPERGRYYVGRMNREQRKALDAWDLPGEWRQGRFQQP